MFSNVHEILNAFCYVMFNVLMCETVVMSVCFCESKMCVCEHSRLPSQINIDCFVSVNDATATALRSVTRVALWLGGTSFLSLKCAIRCRPNVKYTKN